MDTNKIKCTVYWLNHSIISLINARWHCGREVSNKRAGAEMLSSSLCNFMIQLLDIPLLSALQSIALPQIVILLSFVLGDSRSTLIEMLSPPGVSSMWPESSFQFAERKKKYMSHLGLFLGWNLNYFACCEYKANSINLREMHLVICSNGIVMNKMALQWISE